MFYRLACTVWLVIYGLWNATRIDPPPKKYEGHAFEEQLKNIKARDIAGF